MTQEERTLLRDCPATVVPTGEPVIIPKDTEVTITHRLGGNFTVVWQQGMARISSVHSDALGEEKAAPAAASASDHSGPPSQDALWEALKAVFDPEIPVNIVDLGLVYTLDVEPKDGGHHVNMKMTLTAPGCGMGPTIAEDARQKLILVPGVSSAEVIIAWDPPWDQSMISEEGKMILGLI